MLPIIIAGGAGLVAARVLQAKMGRDQVKECVSLLAEYEPARNDGSTASGPVYRNVCALEGFPKLEGVETLYELFAQSVQRFAENPCLGTRTMVDGKAGPYEFLTYAQAGELVAGVGAALMATGLKARQKCAIYGVNCTEWMIAMQACNRQSLYCVPLYDSLGENAVEFTLNHSESSIVFVSAEKLPTLIAALPAVHGGMKALVYWGNPKQEQLDAMYKAAEAAGIKVHSWEQFLGMGRAQPAEAIPPKPEDLCTIMYTSGTTGNPKGVMISHAAVVAEVASIQAFFQQIGNFSVTPDDAMLSYLPLAHIFDRSAEELFLSVGARVGYFQGDPRKLVDDIGALQPTLFIGVPRVFDRIYAGAMAKIEEKGGLAARLFRLGYGIKAAKLRRNIRYDKATPLFDRVVFSKLAARLGGRVRMILSGGAPLAPHTEEFLKVTMCAPVVQGYGLTETCAGTFISVPGLNEMAETVGPPMPATAFRLEAVPEMNYSPSADPPRGEVVISGPTLFSGYYKEPEKTAEVLDAAGWFHSGDIGELTPAGALRIIDRKKNIFKLSQGEYIAVEKVEAVYKKNSLVEQIWVYGNSFESTLVAVVVPNEDALKSWATANSVDGEFGAVVASPGTKEHVLSELTKTGKEGKLKGFEQVRAVHLEKDQFTVEKDLLTPTFKLKRPQLLKYYQAQVDAMYNKGKQ